MSSPVAPDALAVPPMLYYAWATDDDAVSLPEPIKGMIGQVLGATSDSARPVRDADSIELTPVRLEEEDLDCLRGVVGEANVSTEPGQRLPRSLGKSGIDLFFFRGGDDVLDAPDAVVAPHTAGQVLEVLQWAEHAGVAVVPFGGGTSVVGGVAAVTGGHRAVISIDMQHFTAVEDIDHESGLATLGAGLTGPEAEKLLAAEGLQLGHYPQSFPYATIGGYAVTRSSGQSSSGYGRFDQMVHSIEMVTPRGIIDIGRAPASAAGPDLKELVLGSEGTLGVVTKVRLRVHPVPTVTLYATYHLPDFDSGAKAVRMITQQGIQPTVIRLSDEAETAVNLAGHGKDTQAPVSGGCLAVCLFEGDDNQRELLAARRDAARAVVEHCGGTDIGEQPAIKWEKNRFDAPVLRDALMDNGAIVDTVETACDWSKVRLVHDAVGEVLQQSFIEGGTLALVMCHISHVYATGCSLYFTFVAGQRNDPGQQIRDAKKAMLDKVTELGATITHHHAVGTDHRGWMDEEITGTGVEILRAVKNRLDPAGILNPGKLLPDPGQ
ncbi:FAD-binding oxidoreductase [Corynebacterium sp. CCM 8862]|uniref:FAD-binding oxidoreductase n=2 Tax=Corynebacterium mendelii TaxID=2765362 RepID=A0A939IX79_9CORY|nr:FAD-binding oxidoreductase [Corynebacterium mendelii]